VALRRVYIISRHKTPLPVGSLPPLRDQRLAVTISLSHHVTGSTIRASEKIRASDETKLEKISESLGSGDIGTKINSEQKKQGPSESTGVTKGTSHLESTSSAEENRSMAAAIAGGVIGVLFVAAVVAVCLWRKTKTSEVATLPANVETGLGFKTPDENVASNQAKTKEISDSQEIESNSDRIMDGQPLDESSLAVVQESSNVENTVER